jgi:DNA-binding transcriptional MocR family regulator
VSQPEGGFVYWVELAIPIDMAALYATALADGVSIAPGAIFFASGIADRSFRLCIGRLWTARVEQAIAHIGRLCSTLGMRQEMTVLKRNDRMYSQEK